MLTFLLVACAFDIQDPGPRQNPALPEARGWLAKSEPGRARTALLRALERDPNDIEVLALLGDVAKTLGDPDTAVHSWHSWLERFDLRKRTATAKGTRDDLLKKLLELDPEAESWSKLQADYVRSLLTLARDYRQRKDLLSAVEVFQQILEVEPDQEQARQAIAEIRRTGGREVAVEDAFAGGDPSTGLGQEQIAALDQQHKDWDKAFTKETENYKYRTNAGYLVLETSAIAMEQMNRFYRRFFRFKEDGSKTPKIEIRIFRTRDEYLKLGRSPVEWSAGHFIGDAVETYCGGVSGKASALEMYRTLFHEAAHQFVSLSGPFVPGWLNEGYASFFEGCVILSNGTVKANRAPAERLFSIAARMEKGWMKDATDGVRDGAGGWGSPELAPRFATVISGGYEWGPPWYAPTWGVVYFLYNYRDEQGRLVYRDALHDYYVSFKRGESKDPVAHFESVVLKAPLGKVKTIAELDEVWKTFVLGVRDRETGKSSAGDELTKTADQAAQRGDLVQAIELWEEARELRPDDTALLEKLAKALEDKKLYARAADVWRDLKRELEVRGGPVDATLERARKKVLDLDPLARAHARMRQTLAERGLALARGYEQRALPTMALEIARRMSASFSIPEALALYTEIAERTKKSLARWRLAYDERSLAGWTGGDGSYQAYGAMIRADVPDDRSDLPPGGIRTRELLCDVTFDADFSLEAELRIPPGEAGKAMGSLAGLCFARKGAKDFHAVVLHEKGFLDVATSHGGTTWEFLDHRQTPVGTDWHTLRIDVTGRSLDVYLDGFYVRSLEFPAEASVRGAFGLVTGPGQAQFRHIHLLARERYDPAARIERALAMKKVATGEQQRQPGTFSGIASPPLAIGTFVQGAPTTLDALRGRPVLLAFWSPAVEKQIPCARWFAELARKHKAKDLAVVVVCDSGTKPEGIQEVLAATPLPGITIAIDDTNRTFESYWIKPGGFGMPRVLLLQRDGKVAFEGDPGFKVGVGWRAEDGPTFVDGPLEKLLAER